MRKTFAKRSLPLLHLLICLLLTVSAWPQAQAETNAFAYIARIRHRPQLPAPARRAITRIAMVSVFTVLLKART
jgi:hypothetical protein